MTHSQPEINAIKNELSQPGGKLVERFLTFDREKALDFQAGLLVLSKINRIKFRISEIAGLYPLDESKITKRDLIEARRHIADLNVRDKKLPVPDIGVVAVHLKLIDQRQYNLLLSVQALIKTLDVIERAENGKPSLHDLRSVIYDNKKNVKTQMSFAREYIGVASPRVLTQTQALNHIADIYGALQAEIGIRDFKASKVIENSLRITAVRSLYVLAEELPEIKEKLIAVAGYESTKRVPPEAGVNMLNTLVKLVGRLPAHHANQQVDIFPSNIVSLLNKRYDQNIGINCRPSTPGQFGR